MNFSTLREVNPGDSIRAEDWNALVLAVEELKQQVRSQKLSVSEGLELREDPAGTLLSLDIADSGNTDTEEYVHPFKISATATETGAKISVAPGGWLLRQTDSINRSNKEIGVEEPKEVEPGTWHVNLWLALRAQDGDGNGTGCKTVCGAAIEIQQGYEPPTKFEGDAGNGAGMILIELGQVSVEGSVSVSQYWRSDVSA